MGTGMDTALATLDLDMGLGTAIHVMALDLEGHIWTFWH
jgi:hypothetical protein